MIARIVLVAAMLAMASCGGRPSAPQAATSTATTTTANASAESNIGGVVVHASAMPTSRLNAITARQYGIPVDGDALFLLVTVRDAKGDGVPADALQLSAQSAVLPDAPAPLALRAITTAAPGKTGMTDYIAVVPAKPPASVQFKIDVRKGGSNATMAFTQDLLPR